MGKLIVIEGLDGSGKGTQAALLAQRLRAQGRRVRELSFPRYDSESSALVRLYLGGGLGASPDETNAYAASMFYAADRYVSYRTDWKRDADDPETIVVANRYTTANAYHQLAKLPRTEWDSFLAWLWDFEFGRLGLPEPAQVAALSMPPHVSRQLIENRCGETGVKKDIHEADEAYLTRCYDALQYAAGKLGWSVLECSDGQAPYSVEEVQRKLCAVLAL
ncbi:MAG: dTMP kinase [Eubacteriales bacterium]